MYVVSLYLYSLKNMYNDTKLFRYARIKEFDDFWNLKVKWIM